jgi:hypothetical protein
MSEGPASLRHRSGKQENQTHLIFSFALLDLTLRAAASTMYFYNSTESPKEMMMMMVMMMMFGTDGTRKAAAQHPVTVVARRSQCLLAFCE